MNWNAIQTQLRKILINRYIGRSAKKKEGRRQLDLAAQPRSTSALINVQRAGAKCFCCYLSLPVP